MIKGLNLFIGFTLTMTACALESCGQEKDTFLNESKYKYVKKGADKEYPYVITLQNKSDTNWSIKKVYFDSAYNKLISKTFFYNGIPNGPFFTYVNGEIYRKGSYKDGKWDGERITYKEGRISQKAYFKMGVKVGTWIEYDKNEKITRRTDYDNNGNMTQDVTY